MIRCKEMRKFTCREDNSDLESPITKYIDRSINWYLSGSIHIIHREFGGTVYKI